MSETFKSCQHSTVFLKLLSTYSQENSNICAMFCSVTTIVLIYNKIKFRLTSQSLSPTSLSSPFIYLLPSKQHIAHLFCETLWPSHGPPLILLWAQNSETTKCLHSAAERGRTLHKALCNLMTKMWIHLPHPTFFFVWKVGVKPTCQAVQPSTLAKKKPKP